MSASETGRSPVTSRSAVTSRDAVTGRRVARVVPHAEREPLYAAYRAAHEQIDRLGDDLLDDTIIQTAVKAYEAKLIEQGRLLPAPTEVRVEYAAWCHGEDRNGIRLDQDRLASREQAVAWAEEQIGRYGITGYRVMRREHHIFPDGARYTSASTDWVEDVEGER